MEKILCAAIHYNKGKTPVHSPKNISHGYVVCGYRHCDCIGIIAMNEGEDLNTRYYMQGFLTSKNRFVDRKEAMHIAIGSGQLKHDTHSTLLYSEDLY